MLLLVVVYRTLVLMAQETTANCHTTSCSSSCSGGIYQLNDCFTLELAKKMRLEEVSMSPNSVYLGRDEVGMKRPGAELMV